MTKKFALVLGASGEIGSAICRNLAEAGWSLYLHYANNNERIEKLLTELNESYSEQEFMVVHADMSKADCIDSWCERVNCVLVKFNSSFGDRKKTTY